MSLRIFEQRTELMKQFVAIHPHSQERTNEGFELSHIGCGLDAVTNYVANHCSNAVVGKLYNFKPVATNPLLQD